MERAGTLGKELRNGRVLARKRTDPAADGNESLPVMGNSVGPEVEDVGPDRIAEGMEAPCQTVEDVFGLVPLVSDDRVLHPPDVLEDEPVGLQLLEDVDARKYQAVSFVLPGPLARADGSGDPPRPIGGHSLARRRQGKQPGPAPLEFAPEIIDVVLLERPDVPLENLGLGKVSPDKGCP